MLQVSPLLLYHPAFLYLATHTYNLFIFVLKSL